MNQQTRFLERLARSDKKAGNAPRHNNVPAFQAIYEAAYAKARSVQPKSK